MNSCADIHVNMFTHTFTHVNIDTVHSLTSFKFICIYFWCRISNIYKTDLFFSQDCISWLRCLCLTLMILSALYLRTRFSPVHRFTRCVCKVLQMSNTDGFQVVPNMLYCFRLSCTCNNLHIFLISPAATSTNPLLGFF